MRVVGLAALAVCAGLWAGEAGAAVLAGSGAMHYYGDTADALIDTPSGSFLLTVKVDLSRLQNPSGVAYAYYSNFYDTGTWQQFNQLVSSYAFHLDVPDKIDTYGTQDIQVSPTSDGFTLLYVNSGNPCFDQQGRYSCHQVDKVGQVDFHGKFVGEEPISYSWSITDAPASNGVPEPGTWAMMLVGFGLAGAALRHRPLYA